MCHVFSRKAIHIDFLGFHVFHKLHFGVEDADMVEGKSWPCRTHRFNFNTFQPLVDQLGLSEFSRYPKSCGLGYEWTWHLPHHFMVMLILFLGIYTRYSPVTHLIKAVEPFSRLGKPELFDVSCHVSAQSHCLNCTCRCWLMANHANPF